jgi:hypothetical protein
MCAFGELQLQFNLLWKPFVVIIEKRNPSGARSLDAEISRHRATNSIGQGQQANAAIANYAECLLGFEVRAVDDDDDFQVLKSSPQGAANCSEN